MSDQGIITHDDEPAVAPSKSLMSLVSSLSVSNDDSEQSSYSEIYEALGLTGDEAERINLTRFRRIIAENLEVDGSFMYKRVFNAFDTKRNGYLTAKELVSAISVLLQGPFQAQVELGLRVYGKPNVDTKEPETKESHESSNESPASVYTITRVDAILSIVESLQLSSPRARHTLTTDNREKAYHIGEDLVFIIYPKLDIDGDGIISLDDFSKACHDDPSLIQVFGQFLPKNNGVLPSRPGSQPQSSSTVVLATPRSSTSVEAVESIRPQSSSSRSSFEGIDYLTHSPTIGSMWGRHDTGTTLGQRKSERLVPIPVVVPKNKCNM